MSHNTRRIVMLFVDVVQEVLVKYNKGFPITGVVRICAGRCTCEQESFGNHRLASFGRASDIIFQPISITAGGSPGARVDEAITSQRPHAPSGRLRIRRRSRSRSPLQHAGKATTSQCVHAPSASCGTRGRSHNIAGPARTRLPCLRRTVRGGRATTSQSPRVPFTHGSSRSSIRVTRYAGAEPRHRRARAYPFPIGLCVMQWCTSIRYRIQPIGLVGRRMLQVSTIADSSSKRALKQHNMCAHNTPM